MWEVNVRPPSCNKGVRPLEKLPLHVDYSGGSGIRIRILGYGLRVRIKDQASNAKELARPLEKHPHSHHGLQKIRIKPHLSGSTGLVGEFS